MKNKNTILLLGFLGLSGAVFAVDYPQVEEQNYDLALELALAESLATVNDYGSSSSTACNNIKIPLSPEEEGAQILKNDAAASSSTYVCADFKEEEEKVENILWVEQFEQEEYLKNELFARDLQLAHDLNNESKQIYSDHELALHLQNQQ